MNKEHIVSVEQSLCNRCGLCAKDCSHDIWKVDNRGAEITSQDCPKCGHCVAVCPRGAIAISGFDDAPEEIHPEMKPDPDNLFTMIKNRRSTRQFTEQDVPNEIIEKIIEAGRYTPTAMNRQGVSYVVLRDKKDEYEKIAISWWRRLIPIVSIIIKHFRHMNIDDQYCFKGAPVVIVVKSDNVSFGAMDIVDGALAASAMELMARSYGLGVLYSGAFTNAVKFSRKLKRKLSVVSHGKVVIALVIGYPAVKYHRTAQRERPVVQYD